jgi:hypothetical protein
MPAAWSCTEATQSRLHAHAPTSDRLLSDSGGGRGWVDWVTRAFLPRTRERRTTASHCDACREPLSRRRRLLSSHVEGWLIARPRPLHGAVCACPPAVSAPSWALAPLLRALHQPSPGHSEITSMPFDLVGRASCTTHRATMGV